VEEVEVAKNEVKALDFLRGKTENMYRKEISHMEKNISILEHEMGILRLRHKEKD
jgi:hypothetical protein